MWHNRMREIAAIDLVTSGRLSKHVYELVNAMPTSMSKKILSELQDVDSLVSWYENRECYMLNPKELDNVKLEEVEIKKLLSPGVV